MAIFNSYVSLPEGNWILIPYFPIKSSEVPVRTTLLQPLDLKGREACWKRRHHLWSRCAKGYLNEKRCNLRNSQLTVCYFTPIYSNNVLNLSTLDSLDVEYISVAVDNMLTLMLQLFWESIFSMLNISMGDHEATNLGVPQKMQTWLMANASNPVAIPF